MPASAVVAWDSVSSEVSCARWKSKHSVLCFKQLPVIQLIYKETVCIPKGNILHLDVNIHFSYNTQSHQVQLMKVSLSDFAENACSGYPRITLLK